MNVLKKEKTKTIFMLYNKFFKSGTAFKYSLLLLTFGLVILPSATTLNIPKQKTSIKSQHTSQQVNDIYIYSFDSIKSPPIYPGGVLKLYDFIHQNLRYPNTATKARIQGTVLLSFIIEKNGSISNIKIHKSPGYGMGKEISRILFTSRKWVPGMKDGKPIRTRHRIPVKFSLGKKPSATSLKLENPSDLKKHFTSNKIPLFIIDNKLTEVKSLEKLNFNEFLKVEIIKDPNITALQGKRAKNGIVIARTKKAEKALKKRLRGH